MGAEPHEAGGGLGLGPPRTYFLDASLQLPVCRALSLIRDDVLYAGGPGCPVTPGMTDQQWLPIVGAEGWIVLMRDKRIRRRAGEREKLLENGVPAFCLTGAGNYSRWGTVSLLVRRCNDIETTVDREAPPYIFSVTQGGLRRLV